MTTKCPYCKADLEVGEDVAVGQNVTCKYCERKFAYGVETPKPSRITVPVTGGQDVKPGKPDLHVRRNRGQAQTEDAGVDGAQFAAPPQGSDGGVPPVDIGRTEHPDERAFPELCKILYWVLAVVLVLGASVWLLERLVNLPPPEKVVNNCTVDIGGDANIRKDLDEDFILYQDYYQNEDSKFASDYLENRRYLQRAYVVNTSLIGVSIYSRWGAFLRFQLTVFIGLLVLWFCRGFFLVVFGINRNGLCALAGLEAVRTQNDALRGNHLKASQYICDRLAEICDHQKGV